MKTLKALLAMSLLLLNGCAGTKTTEDRTASLPASKSAQDKQTEVVVYRSPTCNCCSKWVEHLEENNFSVKEIRTSDMQAIREKHGVSQELASCHTAIIDGYVVEGHVPASDIRTLLKTKPNVIGIAVPAMPIGTPGMEMGGDKDAYDVIGFQRGKPDQIFNSYKGN
jgi:hypothetical protein